MLAGAVLTGASALLLSLLPKVPTDVAALSGWVEEGSALLMWSDELLFFSILFSWAGAWGVFATSGSRRSVRVVIGLTALALALISLTVVLLTIGRLVYPVFAIQLSDDSLGLLVSATYGALHVALLGFAVAGVTLTWATRALITGRIVGIATAAVFLAGSFPWLTPNWWNTVVAAVLGAWGAFLALAVDSTSTRLPSTA